MLVDQDFFVFPRPSNHFLSLFPGLWDMHMGWEPAVGIGKRVKVHLPVSYVRRAETDEEEGGDLPSLHL